MIENCKWTPDKGVFLFFIPVVWGHKATLAPHLFLIYCASPPDFPVIHDTCTRALWQLLADESSSEAGETWRRNGW
jgi:hypothetical protein